MGNGCVGDNRSQHVDCRKKKTNTRLRLKLSSGFIENDNMSLKSISLHLSRNDDGSHRTSAAYPLANSEPPITETTLRKRNCGTGIIFFEH